jgi:protein SCO1
MKRIAWILLALLLWCGPVSAHEHVAHSAAGAGMSWLARPPALPDVEVTDQDGHRLHFFADLVSGRTVAIDFVFTACSSLCPMLTATMRAVQEELGGRLGEQVRFISISVDPENDTPKALKAYAERFGAAPGWSFVTGAKDDIAKLLKALGESAASRDAHSPVVLIGNERAGRWTRGYGLSPAAALVEAITTAAAAPGRAAAAQYFTNLGLLDQNGEEVHFYDDVIRGKTVLIDFFYASCADMCPLVTANLHRARDYLGDLVGSSVFLVSITADPAHDTPAVLKAYAAEHGTGPGWTFLTGRKGRLDWIAHKLGAYVETPSDHSMMLLMATIAAANGPSCRS